MRLSHLTAKNSCRGKNLFPLLPLISQKFWSSLRPTDLIENNIQLSFSFYHKTPEGSFWPQRHPAQRWLELLKSLTVLQFANQVFFDQFPCNSFFGFTSFFRTANSVYALHICYSRHCVKISCKVKKLSRWNARNTYFDMEIFSWCFCLLGLLLQQNVRKVKINYLLILWKDEKRFFWKYMENANHLRLQWVWQM